MSLIMNGFHGPDEADFVEGHKAVYRRLDDPRLSAEEMDERRKENIAYEYLCHLEEAKVWIEACTEEQLPPTVELEESLRNGVALGKLAHFMSPDLVPLRKVYDKDLSRYNSRGLHFRHTDNVNHWLRALEEIGLPRIFYPETTDIYDRKNMPRVIYCIHALSLYLFKLGKAPQIQDLYGKINFTDEEISNMRRELEKYGIQMPAFGKIGGILATEMPVDEAALHAAVIAINDSVDRKKPDLTLGSLKNPVAHLANILDDLMESYQEVLHDAKATKAQAALNKSLNPDSSYIPDVYDELLTQAEIQGNINKVNMFFTLAAINDALDQRDNDALICALKMPYCRLRDVAEASVSLYMIELLSARQCKPGDGVLSKEEVQSAVHAANLKANESYQRLSAVEALNNTLDGGDPTATLRALQNPSLNLPPILEDCKYLYHEELRGMRAEKQERLDYDEIIDATNVLSAITQINRAIEIGNTLVTFDALSREDAHIANLDESCQDKYQKCLWKAKTAKQKKNEACQMMRYHEIQQCIDDVNSTVMDEHSRIVAVSKINEAIDRKQSAETLAALLAPSAGIQNVDSNEAIHYQQLLYRVKAEKIQEANDPTAVLWFEEIQCTIDMANANAQEGRNMSLCVGAINLMVNNEDSRNLMTCLQDSRAQLRSVTPMCADKYLHKLSELKKKKSFTSPNGSGWVMTRVRGSFKFYYNVDTMEHSWQRTEAIKKDTSLLTHSDIQRCINEVTAAFDRHQLFKTNESFIVHLQAHVRGYLTRRQICSRKYFIRTRLPAVVKIQSWWRMISQRRKFLRWIKFFNDKKDAAVVIQAYVKGYLARKAYLKRQNFYKNHIAEIVRIQAFLRSAWAKHDYKALMHATNPPISVICKFVHLLDIGDNDYTEEIEMEKLRQLAVTEIRANQQLETDLDQMDIKIGLLVKNRINIQDVVSQSKKLTHYEQLPGQLQRGLKSLSKSNRERLEAYQHLFYLLQTNPTYLARLIFAMPQSRTTKFMESAVLTLYNYASNQREEYLLLKLFKTALEEEISKISAMSDIVTGNPLVVKIIVSFNRNARGQSALRELLNPLVRSILDDKNLQINTNPIEVYKQWINQTEAETGRPSGLPYDVVQDTALQHEAVRDRIEQSIQNLQNATERFLSAILESVDKIPYDMRYMAKVMRSTLRARFPSAPEKDIMKIIGNLIYYRYINSAIVAPDAFDIIDVGVANGLTNDQRRNLGSIAKILQFAASNKGFGNDSAHLVCMNKYIMDAHARFKRYFASICEVEELEVVFNMDQYSDVTRITKPIIYISIGEIVEMHKLLLEYQSAVASDPHDPLHELLDDLGEVVDVDMLIGEVNLDENGAAKAQLAKTEISLTLSNKFEIPDSDDTNKTKLFLRTKQMVIDVIRCQKNAESLLQILHRPVTPDEENVHQALVKMRERVDNRAIGKNANLTRNQSKVSDIKLPLEAMKTKIISNLRNLEQLGVVTKSDGYQAVVNSIVQDIRNQRLYRQRRRQDMQRLRTTLKSLSTKRSFYEEQINYYNQYVKTCLDNLAAKRKSTRSDSTPSHKVVRVKYSAARLHDKHVILEIEGLPHNQFKNVQFEISSTETVGTFEVNAKFMGVSMEKVDLVFQNLLELQYEGIAVMKMFDRAQVNVNLLIFLLNKKFFGKK